MSKKSPRCHRQRGQGLNGDGSYFLTAAGGAKTLTNACPFGTPTPVTLSQPTFVCRLEAEVHGVINPKVSPAVQSVSNEITSAVSSIEASSQIALTKLPGAPPPSTASALYLSTTVVDSA